MESPNNIEPETRADIFAGIAGCYARPSLDLGAFLEANAESNGRPADPGAQMFSDLLGQWRKNTLQELLVDYAGLFVGPFETIAPPLGSVYLEDQPTLMGTSTRDILDIYRQAGLDMAESFNGPPDHIIAELEFLAYLVSARLSADTETGQTLHALEQRFLRHHLGAWIEPFTRKVTQGAGTGFYQLLGELTRQAVLAETPI
ncbi:MAG: molecular chaperone TorD family protein [Desulfobacterales bacterium]|nr:molecular chaperone TorD family protein [Desulfobacterales bacterium]